MKRLAIILSIFALAIATALPTATAGACGLHAYAAKVTRVIDGDTVEADIDLGFGFRATSQRIRLAGIDAPEANGDTVRQGHNAREALRDRVEGREVLLYTLPDKHGEARRDGFGRILAILWRQEASGYVRNVNVWLVLTGHAEPSWKPLLLRDLLPGNDPSTPCGHPGTTAPQLQGKALAEPFNVARQDP